MSVSPLERWMINSTMFMIISYIRDIMINTFRRNGETRRVEIHPIKLFIKLWQNVFIEILIKFID